MIAYILPICKLSEVGLSTQESRLYQAISGLKKTHLVLTMYYNMVGQPSTPGTGTFDPTALAGRWLVPRLNPLQFSTWAP
jgi:hypothetical protein